MSERVMHGRDGTVSVIAVCERCGDDRSGCCLKLEAEVKRREEADARNDAQGDLIADYAMQVTKLRDGLRELKAKLKAERKRREEAERCPGCDGDGRSGDGGRRCDRCNGTGRDRGPKENK